MIRTIATLVIFAGFAGTANAAIRCNDDYQIVNGSEIATPYCGDNYVAQVARQYGMRVSNSEVRNNPGRKGDVCRLIGHDSRVQQACTDYKGSGSGGSR